MTPTFAEPDSYKDIPYGPSCKLIELYHIIRLIETAQER